MMIQRCILATFALLGLLLGVSCTGGIAPSQSVPTAITVPTALTVPTTVPTQSVAATSQVANPTMAPTSAPTTAPTQSPAPTVPPTSAAAGPTSKTGTFGKADLDKIFPPGRGQDLVFQACVNCHNWVPLVLAGFDANGWKQNQMNHRNRVSSLSDDDFNYLYQYLVQTFPAGHPVPTNIPEDLLKEWTSY